MRNVSFTPIGWDHYNYWIKEDNKIAIKIMELISNTIKTPFSGIGKPEPLKGNLKGYWSRRITQ